MSATDPQRWQRLSARFEELVEHDWAARESALAQIAREDASFAAELRAMLAADDAAEGLLDGRIVDAAPTVLGRLADGGGAQSSVPPFERVGRFRLLQLLGRGGMGEVWLAEASDAGFVQQVALKLLKRGMDSDEIVHRFERERRILAQLHHPNIASFVDGGIAPDGRPWYAMEHVDGVPITDYAQRQGLDVRERAALLAQVCATVAYAQTRLIVHRDIKPSNVLVGANGQPHVLDFGIAKLLDDTEEAELTRTGTRALSPAYAAPEQVTGAPVSTATDVFALGVVLYELLTGRLPQQRDARPEPEAAAAVTIERPSAQLRRADAAQGTAAYGARADARERHARIMRGDLDTVVLTALRREPERRYASAAALGDDLQRWLAGKPIRARPDSATYRATRFVQRHRVGVVAAALVLVSLLGGIGVALWQAREARAAAAAALAAERRAEEQASIATAVSDFLVRDVIQAANPFQGSLDIKLVDALVAATDRIEARFAGNPRLEGVVRRELGESLMLAGKMDEGEVQSRRALETLELAFGPGDNDALDARLILARMRHVKDDPVEARALLDAGFAALRPDTPNALRLGVLVGLAGVDVEEHEEAKALAALVTLIPEAEAEFGVLQGVAKDAVDHQMRAYMQVSREPEALALAQRLRIAAEAEFGPDDARTTKWLEREAIVLRVLERYDEAVPLARRAYASAVRRIGDDHADTHSARMQLAATLIEAGLAPEAVPLMERAYTFRDTHFGPDNELTWIAAVWYARALQSAGDLVQARAMFERTVASAAKVYGKDDQQALPYAQTLGMFLHQTGNPDAERYRRALLVRTEAALTAEHQITAKFAWDLAETLADGKHDAELVALCTRWLPVWEPLFHGDSRMTSALEWQAAARKRLAAAPPTH